jgi:hypothetical protein
MEQNGYRESREVGIMRSTVLELFGIPLQIIQQCIEVTICLYPYVTPSLTYDVTM